MESRERFRRKIAEMVTNFCLEASVLVSVLGILEAAIAWRGFPPVSDFTYSLGIGAFFFSLGCIIQFRESILRRPLGEEEEVDH